ncbi:hypothetical protein CLOM_g9304 [Closterium sp. NIES-68]|nr:hypothetical protein CLOM_g9304 [Closterium sp. NIES-68]GJP69574.1 hypothetical protein CLOP_g574 [Closterium sp. NIES-67]
MMTPDEKVLQSVENKEPRKSTVKDLARKFDIKPSSLIQGPAKAVSRDLDDADGKLTKSELEELKTRLEKLQLQLDGSQRDEVGSILEIVGKAYSRRSSDRSESKWTEILLKSADLQTQGDDDALLSLLASKGEEVSRLKAEVMELKSRMAGERGIMKYEIQGNEELGSLLFVVSMSDDVAHPSQCNIHWYRSSKDGKHTQLIIGAEGTMYATEPEDLGCVIQAAIESATACQGIMFLTSGEIQPGSMYETLLAQTSLLNDVQFSVLICNKDGSTTADVDQAQLRINKARVKLVTTSNSLIRRESYNQAMQFYGLRWSTNSSSLGACWVPRKGLSFNLMFQSITERNIAIQVARTNACKLKIDVSGPEGHFHGHDN